MRDRRVKKKESPEVVYVEKTFNVEYDDNAQPFWEDCHPMFVKSIMFKKKDRVQYVDSDLSEPTTFRQKWTHSTLYVSNGSRRTTSKASTWGL